MKTIGIMLVLVFAMFAAPAHATGNDTLKQTVKNKDKSVVVISRAREIFYFKISKKFKGGVVEVYDAKNNLIESTSLDRSRMLVDFYDVKAGHYTIKVKKGEEVREFDYVKK